MLGAHKARANNLRFFSTLESIIGVVVASAVGASENFIHFAIDVWLDVWLFTPGVSSTKLTLNNNRLFVSAFCSKFNSIQSLQNKKQICLNLDCLLYAAQTS